jgi:hypothetical protein
MGRYGWDIIPDRPRMPATGETVNGKPFSIPRNAKALTLFLPTLVGAATIAIQVLEPTVDVDAGTENWFQLKVFNLSTGAVQSVAAIASGGVAVTLPISGLGGGVARLVASADQSGTPVNITITFATDT